MCACASIPFVLSWPSVYAQRRCVDDHTFRSCNKYFLYSFAFIYFSLCIMYNIYSLYLYVALYRLQMERMKKKQNMYSIGAALRWWWRRRWYCCCGDIIIHLVCAGTIVCVIIFNVSESTVYSIYVLYLSLCDVRCCRSYFFLLLLCIYAVILYFLSFSCIWRLVFDFCRFEAIVVRFICFFFDVAMCEFI